MACTPAGAPASSGSCDWRRGAVHRKRQHSGSRAPAGFGPCWRKPRNHRLADRSGGLHRVACIRQSGMVAQASDRCGGRRTAACPVRSLAFWWSPYDAALPKKFFVSPAWQAIAAKPEIEPGLQSATASRKTSPTAAFEVGAYRSRRRYAVTLSHNSAGFVPKARDKFAHRFCAGEGR